MCECIVQHVAVATISFVISNAIEFNKKRNYVVLCVFLVWHITGTSSTHRRHIVGTSQAHHGHTTGTSWAHFSLPAVFIQSENIRSSCSMLRWNFFFTISSAIRLIFFAYAPKMDCTESVLQRQFIESDETAVTYNHRITYVPNVCSCCVCCYLILLLQL